MYATRTRGMTNSCREASPETKLAGSLPNSSRSAWSWRSIVRNTHPNRMTFDLHSELKGLPTPTLLIWGKQDRIDPPIPAAIAIADHLPNARLVLLPDAGHAPWMDKPDECATLITEFLRQA